MIRLLLILLLMTGFSPIGAKESAFLSPDEAFQLRLQRLAPNAVRCEIQAAKKHYLYHERIGFTLKNSNTSIPISVAMPKGEKKSDPLFGAVEIHHDVLTARVSVAAGYDLSGAKLSVSYQGCSEEGLCYTPVTKTFDWSRLSLVEAEAAATGNAPSSGAASAGDNRIAQGPGQALDQDTSAAESERIAGLLRSGNLWLVLASFFGFGLLLAFTPCVFPMLPILSSIIVGSKGDLTRGRAFQLSLAYVLGMALTYAAAGMLAGWSGQMLSAALQNPWVLGSFAAVFVVLAFSMFGFYELQLPSALQSRLANATNDMKGGNLGGVFAMGAFSALILGPCVAPPLASALLFISQTRDLLLGGSSLFVMALGMGVPLIIVGTSAGTLLPRAGAWMNAVKKIFGFLLLGVALWLISPVLPSVALMQLLTLLLVVAAMQLSALDPLPATAGGWPRFGKALGVIALLFGGALQIGVLSGGREITQPLAGVARFPQAQSRPETLAFQRVHNVNDLERQLKNAQGKPVLLDFYAEWCVSCKEMERFTFSDPKVQEQLKHAVLLQADVTANKTDHALLLKRFDLFGPPGIVFFDSAGREVVSARVIGYQPAEKFLRSLSRVPGLRKEI